MVKFDFPIDKLGTGCGVLWNAFKRIANGYWADENPDIFHDIGTRPYCPLTPGSGWGVSHISDV
jgi:hypothetical protein